MNNSSLFPRVTVVAAVRVPPSFMLFAVFVSPLSAVRFVRMFVATPEYPDDVITPLELIVKNVEGVDIDDNPVRDSVFVDDVTSVVGVDKVPPKLIVPEERLSPLPAPDIVPVFTTRSALFIPFAYQYS